MTSDPKLLHELAREVSSVLDATLHWPVGDVRYDAKLRELTKLAHAVAGELERARETIARQQHEAAIAAGTILDETREIEGALVDALEEELEDYQNAPASWKAVGKALDGLRARDARLAKLDQLVAALEADAAAGNLDAQLAVALAKYKGG